MAKRIKLTKNTSTIVDDEDYIHLSQWSWHLNDSGYARRTQRIGLRKDNKSKAIFMHRYLLNPKSNEEVDHINGDRLDNRKCNLRIANDLQNSRNVSKRKNCSSKYKGVSWHKASNKWQVRLGLNKRKIQIGLFDNEIEAAKAYNKKALEIYGEFAKLNEVYKAFKKTKKS